MKGQELEYMAQMKDNKYRDRNFQCEKFLQGIGVRCVVGLSNLTKIQFIFFILPY